jgi:hypothetical protein
LLTEIKNGKRESPKNIFILEWGPSDLNKTQVVFPDGETTYIQNPPVCIMKVQRKTRIIKNYKY